MPTNAFVHWFSVASQSTSVRIQPKGNLNLTLNGVKTSIDNLMIGEDANYHGAEMIWNNEVCEPPETGLIAVTLGDLMSREYCSQSPNCLYFQL